MKRTLFSLAIVICTMLFLSGVQTANAELIMKDSTDFTWKYEMDVNPATQDLDTNAGADWEHSKGAFTLNGDGTATMGLGTDDKYGTLRALAPGDTAYNASVNAGSVWNSISDASGFTAELKIKCDGGLYIYTDAGDSATKCTILVIGDSITRWGSYDVLSTEDNSDAFHVFRIAQEANSATYTVWRDGELLGTGLTESTNFTAGMNRLQFGDGSTGFRGPNVVDYMRVTTGAFAPVPEPSTLALLTAGLVGLLAYAWRKRK